MRLLPFILIAVGTTAAQPRKLLPVDESAKDASFAAFRSQLLAALQRHDRAFLLDSIDPQIKVDFGGGAGRADFREAWKLDQPDSQLWKELTTILRLGGVWEGETFIAPYVYARFPQGLDAFEYLAAVAKAVPLRRAPRLDAPVIASLSWDIVRMTAPSAPEGWWHVRAPSGRTGFVREDDVRSPVQYRAFFEKKNGRWQMTLLVTGD